MGAVVQTDHDTAWLIEAVDIRGLPDEPGMYATVLDGMFMWTRERDDALRFARDKDALMVLEALADKGWCPRRLLATFEHSWKQGQLAGGG